MAIKKLTPEQVARIPEMYETTRSKLAIAREFGVCPNAIQWHLEKTGWVKTRSRDVNLNHGVFDELTPQSCYWAGFLFADGRIAKNGNSHQIVIGLCNIDEGHLVKFRDFVGSHNKITQKAPRTFIAPNGKTYTSKGMSQFCITSKNIHDRLVEIGYSGLSSRPCNELSVSKDFWRGVIDGDGTIGVYKKGVPEIGLVGGKPIVQAFIDFVKLYVRPEFSAVPHKHSSIFRATLSARKAKALIPFLYKDAPVYLDRKYVKAMEIINGN